MLSRKPGGMGGYAEYAFGKAGNYMANYTYGLSLVIANVAIGVTAVGYGTVLFDATLSPLQTGLWTIFLLVLTTVANFGGSRITGRIGAVTVWGVIIPVVVVSLIGWFWFSGATWGAAWNPNNLPFGPAVGSSIAVTLWAFLGRIGVRELGRRRESGAQRADRRARRHDRVGDFLHRVDQRDRGDRAQRAPREVECAVRHRVRDDVHADGRHDRHRADGDRVHRLAARLAVHGRAGVQNSADVGYFLPVFARATRTGTPIVGMVILLVAQVALALMTISPELSSQFQKIVDLAVVTNLVPYVMSMAALITIQKVAKVPPAKALLTNVIAMVATAYSFYALFSSGEQALMLGGLCVFLGWTLFGFVSARFYQMEVDAHVKEPGKSLQA